MAIDSFGTLLSSAASFLMEHVQPLKEQSYSTTWGNVSQELGKIAGDYQADDSLAKALELTVESDHLPENPPGRNPGRRKATLKHSPSSAASRTG